MRNRAIAVVVEIETKEQNTPSRETIKFRTHCKIRLLFHEMAFGNVLFELTISIVEFVQRIIVQNIDVAVSSLVQRITRFVGMNCS